MRIATKTRYALRFMIDLAEHESEGRIPMKKIAQRQLISKKYLEQVVAPLSEAGLITVTRGATGGYAIARPAREITLDEIVRATEGDLYLLDCLEGSFDCPLSMRCSTQRVWKGLEHAVTSYLRGITLEDALDLEQDDAARRRIALRPHAQHAAGARRASDFAYEPRKAFP